MEPRTLEPPEEFTELVRDALLNLYDSAVLQTHPLLAVAAPDGEGGRYRWLRQALLDAIEALHPGSGVPSTSRAWRKYRILEQRYLEDQLVATVLEKMALSASQYHREHHQALQAVAAFLWERWQLGGRWPIAAGLPQVPAADAARREAEQLLPARGEAGRSDLAEVLQGVRQVLAPLCQERGSDLQVRLPARLPTVAGERVALRQALLSLLAHAITTSNGGMVDIAASYEAEQLVVTIRGVMADGPEPDRLGIAESRPFVEALKGDLTYRPPAGRDACWTLHLGLPASTQPTVLVVDNSADFIRLVEHYLRGHDWHVVGAPDVDQAGAYAQHQPPQAILLDLVMPGRDGWDLLLELKARPATRTIPVLVCSVLDEPAVALALGVAAYLHKPVDECRLVTALRPFR